MSVHALTAGTYGVLRCPKPFVPDGGTRQTATGRKDDVIQIRASADTKAILNRAAALRGQKLSESQGWKTFLRDDADGIASVDRITQPFARPPRAVSR
jgi:hypothetical protein